MLSETQWAEVEPLIEACRPKGKTPSQDLLRTISAILWRHQNGATWRAIPAELGPWWHAAQIFIRWARRHLGAPSRSRARPWRRRWHGIFRRHQHPDSSEGCRRGQKGGLEPSETIVKLDDREAHGRSRGGFGTKACVIADGRGHPIGSRLAPGQAHDMPYALPLLDRVPGVPK